VEAVKSRQQDLPTTEKSLKRRPLVAVLALPVVLVIVSSVVITGWIAFRNGTQAVNDLATQLHQQASITVCDHLDSYLLAPRLANDLVAEEIATGKLRIDDLSEIQSRFKTLKKKFPYTIGYAFLGTDGSFVAYGRQEDAALTSSDTSAREFTNIALASTSDKSVLSTPVTNFFSELTTEMKNVADKQTGKAYWSNASSWPGSSLSLSTIQPVFRNKRLVGILSATVSSRRIGRYLSAYPVTQHSQAFILERNGTLLASSVMDVSEARAKGNGANVSAVESKETLIRNTTRQLSQLPLGLAGFQEPYVFSIRADGLSYLCRVTTYRDILGLDLLVVSAIPESDFMSNIRSSALQTIYVVLASILFGALMTTLIARRIAHPISILNVSAKAIAEGDWTRPIPSTRLEEVGELSDSFRRMADQLQRAFASIQSSEKRYRNMFENSPVSLLEMDLSEVQNYIKKLKSSGVEDILNYFKHNPDKADECIALAKVIDVNVATLQLLHAKDRENLLANLPLILSDTAYRNYQIELFDSLARVSPVRSDTILLTIDKTPIYVNICSTILPDSEETWARVLVSAIDITARQLTQEQTNKLNAILEDRVRERTAQLVVANHELEAFAYSVSHDLRAPLRSIEGYSRIFQLDYASVLDQEAMEYMARIRATSQRMSDLIDALLSLSRIARKEMTLGSHDVSAVAQEIATDLQASHPERKVEFVIEDGITVRADAVLLRIVLDNLLANAWKFTSHNEHARIEIGTLSKNGECVCYVRDNGVGFDKTYADKMFDAFQRLHTDEFEGTGIGLAIVQRIIHRHGGEVWADGSVGEGATFCFTLPSGVSNT
jgi:signal transduction histidine kinase